LIRKLWIFISVIFYCCLNIFPQMAQKTADFKKFLLSAQIIGIRGKQNFYLNVI